MKVGLKLIRIMLKEPLFLVLAVMLGFFTVAANIGLMSLSALLIADAGLRVHISEIMPAVAGVRFFGIGRAVLRYAERIASHSAALRILSNIRVWFYKKVEPLIPEKMNEIHSSDLFGGMVHDIESLKEFFLRVFNPPLVAGAVMIFMSIFLSLFSFTIALVYMVSFLAAGFVLPVLVGNLGKRVGRKSVELRAQFNSITLESMAGMSEILTFDMEQEWKSRFERISTDWMRQNRRSGLLSGLADSMSLFSGNACMWAALVAAVPLVAAGRLEGHYLPVIALGVLSSFEAVQPMQHIFQRFAESRESASRLFEIADKKVNLQEKVKNSRNEGHGISIDGIFFRYPGKDKWAVEDLSLSIPEGYKVAIVGQNGSGKSTLVQLLLRFMEYNKGRICFGNSDIREMEAELLRECFSVVPQNPYLFNTTIRQNLKLANPQATEELLVKALKDAMIYDFVSTLPEGMDTHIGEGGFKLSGGQRQRIAVSRALLKDSSVLVLDEPTVGLDNVTARKLMESVLARCKDKSLILVTHHPETLDRMDEIVVLDSGRISARGTHEELLEKSMEYRRIWHGRQFETIHG